MIIEYSKINKGTHIVGNPVWVLDSPDEILDRFREHFDQGGLMDATRVFANHYRIFEEHADAEICKMLGQLAVVGLRYDADERYASIRGHSKDLIAVALERNANSCVSALIRCANENGFLRDDKLVRKYLEFARDTFGFKYFDEFIESFAEPRLEESLLEHIRYARSSESFANLHHYLANVERERCGAVGFLMREYLLNAEESNLVLVSHDTRRGWHKAWALAEARREGYSLSDLETSIAATGPRYLATDEQGVPIFGKIQHRPEFAQPGLDSLTSVVCKDGDLQFVGPPTKAGDTPKISDDDIFIALYLAFSSSKPVLPNFSLESFAQAPGTLGRFHQKEFSPHYLAKTNLGRTLYYTDFLMKGLAMGPAIASVADPFYSQTHDELGKAIPPVIAELENKYGEASSNGLRRRMAFELEKLEYQYAIHEKRTGVYKISNITMKIDSSQIKKRSDGTEDRTVNRNDPNTPVGAFAQYFAENYEEIAQIFPEFERLRQLFGLVRILTIIRNDGFQPGKEIQRAVTFAEKRANEPPSKLEIVAKPYHRGGCVCDGGVDFDSGKTYRQEFSSLDEAIREENRRASMIREQEEEIKQRRQMLEGIQDVGAPVGHTMDTFRFAKKLVCETIKPVDHISRKCLSRTDYNYEDAVGVLAVSTFATGIALYKAGKIAKKKYFD